jgi:predicted transcriptional regulator
LNFVFEVLFCLNVLKDTDEEINYWLNGLKKMQSRFNTLPGVVKASLVVPKKALPLPEALPAALVPEEEGPLSPSRAAATGSPSAVKTPAFARVNPSASARSSLFQASPVLEGWSQLNITKDVAKKSKGLKAGHWVALWFCQQDFKLNYYLNAEKEEVLGVIDLAEVTQVEVVTQDDVVGDVIRLMTKSVVYMMCAQNAEMFQYWSKGIAALRKRLPVARGNSSSDLPTAVAVAGAGATQASSPLSEGSLSIGRMRNKTVSSSRASYEIDAPTHSPKASRTEQDKVVGWLQHYSTVGKNGSKGIFGSIKKITASKWSPLWCSLSGSVLSMQRSQDDSAVAGEIDLEQVSQVDETSDKEMVGRVLRLTMAPGDINFLCPKEAEFSLWNERVNAVVTAARAKNPGLASVASASVLSASSPGLSRMFGKGRTSTAPKIVVERPVPTGEGALSGWV